MKSIKHYIHEALKLGTGKRQGTGNNFGVNIIEDEEVVSKFNTYSPTQVDNAHETLIEFLSEFCSVGIKCAELFYSGNSGYALYHTKEPAKETMIGYIMYERSNLSGTANWYFEKNKHYIHGGKEGVKIRALDKMLKWKKIEQI